MCPAVGGQICPTCCGTKRLVEIRCPSSCAYLNTARTHPAAVTVKQHSFDVGVMTHALRDLSERQAELFLRVGAAIVEYRPSDLESVHDEDVEGAADALAATFDTASRGIIYDHTAASPSAGRLAQALKSMLLQADAPPRSTFERDAALVLRRMAETVRAVRAMRGESRGEFVAVLSRVAGLTGGGLDGAEERTGSGEQGRLIVP
jgi:hypothetical protein